MYICILSYYCIIIFFIIIVEVIIVIIEQFIFLLIFIYIIYTYSIILFPSSSSSLTSRLEGHLDFEVPLPNFHSVSADLDSFLNPKSPTPIPYYIPILQPQAPSPALSKPNPKIHTTHHLRSCSCVLVASPLPLLRRRAYAATGPDSDGRAREMDCPDRSELEALQETVPNSRAPTLGSLEGQ